MAEGGMMRGQGSIRVALAFAVLLASQALVIWRQSRTLEVLRDLDADRRTRAVVESERAKLTAELQVLESRARVRRVAESRLGMRVPTAADMVVLRRGEPLADPRADNVRVAMAAGAAPADGARSR
jgi:cell division protein FtsL